MLTLRVAAEYKEGCLGVGFSSLSWRLAMRTLLLGALTGLCLLPAVSIADEPRDAEAILKDYQAVKLPSYDSSKREDQAYLRAYMDERSQAVARQNELALELFKAHPQHEQAVQLMLTRWRNLRGPDAAKAVDEMDQFVKDYPDSPKKKDVRSAQVMLLVNTAHPDRARAQKLTDEFIKEFPKDEMGAQLLMMQTWSLRGDKAAEEAIYRRIAAEYPGTRSAKFAEGNLRQFAGIGQPFELAFTDAMTDKPVSIKGLAGKVVVVDFWATWCGPCIAEMPKMKELYAKYKDQGVEFIGVSLDQPGEGLKALKKYVEENDISWPQYYQGNGWDSDFSLSWGINGIPALFVVDAEGNLYSTAARSKLETIIPELIKKRDDKG
jgi:thiol-disulfide isomerase/thioredoxin